MASGKDCIPNGSDRVWRLGEEIVRCRKEFFEVILTNRGFLVFGDENQRRTGIPVRNLSHWLGFRRRLVASVDRSFVGAENSGIWVGERLDFERQWRKGVGFGKDWTALLRFQFVRLPLFTVVYGFRFWQVNGNIFRVLIVRVQYNGELVRYRGGLPNI